jgi:hypothetical protein
MPALSAHGLVKRYGTRVALDGVSRSYAWSINRTTRAQSWTLIGGAGSKIVWPRPK